MNSKVKLLNIRNIDYFPVIERTNESYSHHVTGTNVTIFYDIKVKAFVVFEGSMPVSTCIVPLNYNEFETECKFALETILGTITKMN